VTHDPDEIVRRRLAEMAPGSAYMAALKQRTAERMAKRAADRAATRVDPRAVLRAKVKEWWDELPPYERKPRYLLEELVPLFGCTPQQLGVALWEIGWRRKRVWREDGPYRRFWLPRE
jgi:crotonobetainyl-CoA:carnitine CoA-transferase CaiB-like acyl-CoA transferase